MNQGELRYVSGQGHASVDYKLPVGAVLGIFATFLPGLRPFLYPLLRLIALQWVADFPVLGKKNCLGKFILDLNICPSVLHRLEQGYLEGVTFILEGCSCIKIPWARLWLIELMERDNLDLTAAMVSESQARVIVSVGREDDVEFQALCDARGVPVLRVCVTDKENQAVDIQGVAKLELEGIRAAWGGVLPGLY